ncbi:MAG: T9SS type A sorting domain-containing protein [Candidatus Marinimicrobia bacterium]|nr:T9SS type A sorting domain-containing protein [Candidatus Neomarinimicrobiota bacterium]
MRRLASTDGPFPTPSDRAGKAGKVLLACCLAFSAAAAQSTSNHHITLSLPNLSLAATVDTVVVPVTLSNRGDEIGGLQLDLRLGAALEFLATVRTTSRTQGWQFDLTTIPQRAVTRILLFDPGGENIAMGDGPVLELVLVLPPEGAIPARLLLLVDAAVVSDPVGSELPVVTANGSLSFGSPVTLKVGAVEADQGDRVRLPVALSNEAPVEGIQFSLSWDTAAVDLIDVIIAKRAARLQLEWARDDSGAWVWLYAASGKGLQPGDGDILYLTFSVALGVFRQTLEVRARDVRVMEGSTRQRRLDDTISGQVSVYPGFLAPPRALVADSGLDATVPLRWSPPPHSARARPQFTAGGSASGPLALTGYRIYRALGDTLMLDQVPLLATVPPNVLAYADTGLISGLDYTYTVTAQYADSLESGPSNRATATPASWVTFSLGRVSAFAGGQAVIPVGITNDQPVAGVRFELRIEPPHSLGALRLVLGPHSPPDWVAAMNLDTTGGVLSVVALSPRLTTMRPGEGEAFRLVLTANTTEPATVLLMAENVVISDLQGNPFHTRVLNGSVDVIRQVARLRVGTGAPTLPGDTGTVTIFLDNPLAVVAFQLELRAASDALQVLSVRAGPRLPPDGRVTRMDAGPGRVRLIGSSFSNTPIMPGIGPVATILYRLAPDAPDGLIALDLVDVVLSDEEGHTLSYSSTAGAFPAGAIRAVFAPGSGQAAPGQTVTLPVGLTNSVELCSFSATLHFDVRYLSLLSLDRAGRLADGSKLAIERLAPGRVLMGYEASAGEEVPAGTGALIEAVFVIDPGAPVDTLLAISLHNVSAEGCQDLVVFAMGQRGAVYVGRPPPGPIHFRVQLTPTGVTHFIKVQAATLGGAYLRPGDELAVIDASNPSGQGKGFMGRIVGAGLIQADGSTAITAIMGFTPEPGAAPLPGAGAGAPIYFQAWNRSEQMEGQPTTDARFVLGAGMWGENNGLTIVDLVRVPAKASPPPKLQLHRFHVEPSTPNPFDSTTTIKFGLAEEAEVRVAIYDLLGRQVVTLHDGKTPPGLHQVVWNGSNTVGAPVSSGMYFYQVRTPDQTITRKLLLMR